GNATTSKSSIELDVASTDVADTLRAFNYRDLITGKRANAHATLTWPGGVDDDLLGRSSGTVQIEMFDGQLLSVNPGGAGRMLGLLSIGALPRRLSLDFSDVTEKGFSFDKIHADFQFVDGDAFTNNLLLSGPQAEVGIVGRTGFGKRDYDQTAVVAGDIGGSLSVAGAVVGGPVLGAAVLAFSRLFKEPLKGVTRRYYRISGPWENPSVDRIDRQEARQENAEAAAAAAVSGSEHESTENTESAAPNVKAPPPRAE
ncbi:MAG TPA: AsmA-like C-terminal region-containing protein, partial [Steroidobacteraceae bacterium]|nr:AsmA-like C-terminal region-containing protein [Steroidobacteraceae bacterium]